MHNFTSVQNKSKDITELQDKVDVMIFIFFIRILLAISRLKQSSEAKD